MQNCIHVMALFHGMYIRRPGTFFTSSIDKTARYTYPTMMRRMSVGHSGDAHGFVLLGLGRVVRPIVNPREQLTVGTPKAFKGLGLIGIHFIIFYAG